jgi:hypothetical protein
MCQNVVVEKFEILSGVVWNDFRLQSLFLMVFFIKSGGLLQKGLHLLFVRMFVSNEFLRRFQLVVTFSA